MGETFLGLGPRDWQAVGLSLRVAAAGVLLSLPLGLGLGWLLARKNFPGKTLVETVVNVPLVLPPVVTGYLLLILLGRKGWVGSWLVTAIKERMVGRGKWYDYVAVAALIVTPLTVLVQVLQTVKQIPAWTLLRRRPDANVELDDAADLHLLCVRDLVQHDFLQRLEDALGVRAAVAGAVGDLLCELSLRERHSKPPGRLTGNRH